MPEDGRLLEMMADMLRWQDRMDAWRKGMDEWRDSMSEWKDELSVWVQQLELDVQALANETKLGFREAGIELKTIQSQFLQVTAKQDVAYAKLEALRQMSEYHSQRFEGVEQTLKSLSLNQIQLQSDVRKLTGEMGGMQEHAKILSKDTIEMKILLHQILNRLPPIE